METAKYVLDFFFDWSVSGNIWHFVGLLAICGCLSGKTTIYNENDNAK